MRIARTDRAHLLKMPRSSWISSTYACCGPQPTTCQRRADFCPECSASWGPRGWLGLPSVAECSLGTCQTVTVTGRSLPLCATAGLREPAHPTGRGLWQSGFCTVLLHICLPSQSAPAVFCGAFVRSLRTPPNPHCNPTLPSAQDWKEASQTARLFVSNSIWRAPIAACALGGLMVALFNVTSCLVLIGCVQWGGGKPGGGYGGCCPTPSR